MPEIDHTTTILKNARALIAEKGWTQHTFARDAAGKKVNDERPEATCFCMVGAIHRAFCDHLEEVQRLDHKPCFSGHFAEACDAVEAVTQARSGVEIAVFNDHFAINREAVLSVFDEALALRTPAPTPEVAHG